jgi:hypothetical protein
MSRIGIILCLIYAVLIVICVAFAYSAGGDFKGQYVILQLPLILQMAVVHGLGLSAQFQNVSWVGAYVILGLPTFVLLYLLGWVIDGRSSNHSLKRDA